MKKINKYISEKLHINKDYKLGDDASDDVSLEVAVLCKHVIDNMKLKYKYYIHVDKEVISIEFDEALSIRELNKIVNNITDYIKDNQTEDYLIDIVFDSRNRGGKYVNVINVNITQ